MQGLISEHPPSFLYLYLFVLRTGNSLSYNDLQHYWRLDNLHICFVDEIDGFEKLQNVFMTKTETKFTSELSNFM